MGTVADPNRKLVIFGAGRIGRSFIGQLFSRGGYEIVFIDIYRPIVDELNRRRQYPVVIKGDLEEVIKISPVSAIYADDIKSVHYAIRDADLLSVCVGQAGLPAALDLIAGGLDFRFAGRPEIPIDLILAENLRNASEYFKRELKSRLKAGFPLEKYLGLVETSIGKMVPILEQKLAREDLLQVIAEPYNTLILDAKAFLNPIPDIPGLAPKINMKAWVDRKLFIHNLGHATAAYLGYRNNQEYRFIYEVLDNYSIKDLVRETMLESAQILLREYPEEFTSDRLTEHIDDLLHRFANRTLGDTIFRVGSDLFRKLGSDDRLAGAIKLAIKHHSPYSRILYALVSGTLFKARDENGLMLKSDQEFHTRYPGWSDSILTDICGFDPEIDKEVYSEAREIRSKFMQQNQ